MKNFNLRNWIPILLVGIWISSCGPASNGGEQPSTNNDSLPVDGDWVRAYQTSDPDGLHPYATRNAFANYVKENIYMYLCDLNPATNQIEPTLATADGVISDDGLNYTYEIIPEARWDNGDPITAEDYAFSMKCVLNPLGDAKHLQNYFADFIKDVKIDPENPRRFTISIKQPFFLAESAISGLEIVSKNFFDPNHLLDDLTVLDFTERPEELMKNENLQLFSSEFASEKIGHDPKMIYGSGPYKVESMVTGSSITLVKKKDWWGDKLRGKKPFYHAYPEKIIYKTITDRSTLPAIARAEEIDVIRDMTPQDFTEARDDTSGFIYKNYNFFTPPSYSFIFLGFNARPPAGRPAKLEDKRVRKAIAHLVDIERIIKDVYGGFGVPQIGPISVLNKNEYNSDIKGVEYNLEKAKALLDEAGWIDTDGNGVRDKVLKGKKEQLSLEVIISNSSETAPKMCRMIADQAKKIGVDLDIQIIDFGTLSKRLAEHQFDMAGLGLQGAPIPSDLMQVWHTDNWLNGGSNYYGFGTPESDSLIELIRATPTVAARKPLYFRFQEIIQEEQPMIFLMAPTERIIIHKRFKTAKAYSIRPGYKVAEFWAPKSEQKFK